MVHEAHEQVLPAPRRRVRSAGWLLGAGLAGLMEGIVFHEILGWHHFVQEAGARSDGLFHLATWILAVAAIAMLWRARARFAEPGAGRVLTGSALVGAALLQLLDALVNHVLLRLHVLHPQGEVLAWEIGWIAFTVALLLVGVRLLASATRLRGEAPARRPLTRRVRGTR